MKESSMERLGVLEGKFNAIRRWKGGTRGIMERLGKKRTLILP